MRQQPGLAGQKAKFRKPLEPEPVNTLHCGVSRICITPPPGLSMAGFSAFSMNGNGFRQRLYATAIYLKNKEQVICMASLDLMSGDRMLHHKVAELIAPHTDIPWAGLSLMGTHTHSAPGNYFESRFYNDGASSQPHLDPTWYRFLAKQISEACIGAYHESGPAKAGWGELNVPGLTRNRSYNAFLANENINANDWDKLKAVNDLLSLLRVDRVDKKGKLRPYAAFSSFSIHPNVPPSLLGGLYNGDVFGFASREFSRLQKIEHGQEVSLLAVNGAHGDNNTNYSDKQVNFTEMKDIGDQLGKKNFELFESLSNQLSGDFPLQVNAEELNVQKNPELNGVKICSKPAFGLAIVGGAQGGYTEKTFAYFPLLGAGYPKQSEKTECHGEKRVPMGKLFGTFWPASKFPSILLNQLLVLGDRILLPLPIEVTYEMGRRMEDRIGKEIDGKKWKDSKVIVISCANGYWGYATTPEEYSRQFYEGGHTIYGPNTGNYLAEVSADLVSRAQQSGSSFKLNQTEWSQRIMVRKLVPAVKPDPEINPQVLSAPEFDEEEKAWTMLVLDQPPGAINWNQSLMSVEKLSGKKWETLNLAGLLQNDEGSSLAVTLLPKQEDQNGRVYAITWYQAGPLESGSFRLKWRKLAGEFKPAGG